IFGMMTTKTAMFAVVRKWIMGEEDISIFPTFWGTYRKDFFKTNILGVILFLIGYMLIMEFKILRLQEDSLYIMVSFSVLAILILYVIVFTYFFHIYVPFDFE